MGSVIDIFKLASYFPDSPHKVQFETQKFPKFRDNRYLKVVRLSDLRTGRLYLQVIFLDSFLLEAESTLKPQLGRKG
jgi:hypothetical protein